MVVGEKELKGSSRERVHGVGRHRRGRRLGKKHGFHNHGSEVACFILNCPVNMNQLVEVGLTRWVGRV